MTPSDDYPAFVAQRFKVCDKLPLTLHHATTGLATELLELWKAVDDKNFIEELGDIEFYLQAFKLHWPVSNRSEVPPPPEDVDPLLLGVEKLLSATKKLWIYNTPLEEVANDIQSGVKWVENALEDHAVDLGLLRDEIRAHNMEKLLKRYPTGYSDAAANARADKPAGE